MSALFTYTNPAGTKTRVNISDRATVAIGSATFPLLGAKGQVLKAENYAEVFMAGAGCSFRNTSNKATVSYIISDGVSQALLLDDVVTCEPGNVQEIQMITPGNIVHKFSLEVVSKKRAAESTEDGQAKRQAATPASVAAESGAAAAVASGSASNTHAAAVAGKAGWGNPRPVPTSAASRVRLLPPARVDMVRRRAALDAKIAESAKITALLAAVPAGGAGGAAGTVSLRAAGSAGPAPGSAGAGAGSAGAGARAPDSAGAGAGSAGAGARAPDSAGAGAGSSVADTETQPIQGEGDQDQDTQVYRADDNDSSSSHTATTAADAATAAAASLAAAAAAALASASLIQNWVRRVLAHSSYKQRLLVSNSFAVLKIVFAPEQLNRGTAKVPNVLQTPELKQLEGTKYYLPNDHAYVIGRHPDSDLMLAQYTDLFSRKAATLTKRGDDGVFVEVGGVNGITTVDSDGVERTIHNTAPGVITRVPIDFGKEFMIRFGGIGNLHFTFKVLKPDSNE